MKKSVLFLAILTVLSLSACGEKSSEISDTDVSDTTVSETTSAASENIAADLVRMNFIHQLLLT